MTVADRFTAGPVRRYLAVVAALAMAIALLPLAGSANAQETPVPSAITVDDACNNVPDQGFTDVTEGATFADLIQCLAAYEITLGVGDGSRYAPSETVPRWQMALFIQRFLELVAPAEIPDNVEPQGFTDIAELGAEAQSAINILASLDVTLGTTATTYSPFNPVKRDQMASFINRAIGVLGNPVTTDQDFFTDDEDSVHEDNINALASIGVVQGVGNNQFNPNNTVTRAQMSAFLIRPLEYEIEQGNFESQFPPEPVTNQDFTVDPAEDVMIAVGDQQAITVSDVDVANVDIALITCADVTVSAEGVATFTDEAAPTGGADLPADVPQAAITVVNGVDIADTDYVDNAAAVAGTVQFTVTGSADVCVRAVVFADADNDNQLDVDAEGLPTEDFAVTTQISIQPAEAAGGAIAAGGTGQVNATRVDEDADFFVGCVLTADTGLTETQGDCATYNYDSNDNFSVDGVPATLAEFEAALSAGDDVGGTYAPNPDLASTFNLEDEAPQPPATVTVDAAGTTDTAVEIDFTAPATGAPDEYRIYRTVDPTPLDACPAFGAEYTLVATVEGNVTTFTSTGLTAETAYCFAVTAVQDGDESAAAGPVQAVTLAPGDVAAPTIANAVVATDVGFVGIVDSGDAWRLEFDEALAAAANTGDFLMTDPDGDLILVDCAGATATPDPRERPFPRPWPHVARHGP